MSTKTLKIIRGIAQAASKRYDGALDDNNVPINMGLKRDNGDPVLNSRIMDGWNVRIQGDQLIFTYSSNIKIKETHAPGFENEQIQYMNRALKWLKAEYNKITGDTLSLTKAEEPKTVVRTISNIRAWVQLIAVFKIGGLTDVTTTSQDQSQKDWKTFVAMAAGNWGKGPRNPAQKGPEKTG
jgi:hypothetical protein